MPIAVPKERVYYLETHELGDVALCWFPVEDLKARVGQSADPVKADILTDYPDGLDLEVRQSELDYYQARYGLAVDAAAPAVLVAFAGLYASKVADMPDNENLDVKADVVEDLARELAPAVAQASPPVTTLDEAQAFLAATPDVQAAIDQQLEGLRAANVAFDMDAEPWQQRALGGAQMAAGQAPAVVFSRLARMGRSG